MISKWFSKRNINRIVYVICFFMFVVIDQRVKTVPSREGWLNAWQNMLGLVVCALIFTHYTWEDVKRCKKAYILWGIIGTICCAIYYIWRSKETVFFANANIVLLLDAFLLGFVLIHTIDEIIVQKHFPQIKSNFIIIWFIMMFLMVISKSEFKWPFAYLLLFGLFYLTDFTREEITDIALYGCGGMVLAFLVIQGLAFVVRPYDTLRYYGNYTNSNQTALFYLATLCAVVTFVIYYKKARSRYLHGIFLLGICVVLDFVFLTQGRTAMLVAGVLVLLLLCIISAREIKTYILKKCAFLIIGTIVLFPLCFATIRYIPPIFHHPIWFDGEWSEEKVHSWDSWDSPKYTDFDEFLELALGRFEETASGILKNSPFKLNVDASEVTEQDMYGDYLLTEQESSDSMNIRRAIYKYYFENLNWTGQPYSEQGVQVAKSFFSYHAHNLYLQYGTDFGIPVMIILIILVIWSCCIYGKRIYKESNIEDIAMLMFILIPALYGILEYSWGVGSIGTTMLFISWRIPEWKN